jgi:hypothetical protein
MNARQKEIHVSGLIACFLIVLGLGGCQDSFSPEGPYQQRLVVYSVLSNRSDSQFVRTFTTYDPATFDPLKGGTGIPLHQARVTITCDTATYNLQETSVTLDDSTGSPALAVAYLAFPCPVRPGKQYSLSVTSNQGLATAHLTVPAHGSVDCKNPLAFKQSDEHPDPITASLNISSGTLGYVVRLYIDVDIGPTAVRKRLEIPIGYTATVPKGTQYRYPTLVRRPEGSLASAFFPHDVFVAFLKDLALVYGSFQLVGATFILTELDENLYKYYKIANGFEDLYSIREDQPDFSNINGGVGVFGAMVEDSSLVNLQ